MNCLSCRRPMVRQIDANGFGYTDLCRYHDWPDASLTIDSLGGIPSGDKPTTAPAASAKQRNPRAKGVKSMRCSMCNVNWPVQFVRCPNCYEPTSPWKSEPDSMLDQ